MAAVTEDLSGTGEARPIGELADRKLPAWAVALIEALWEVIKGEVSGWIERLRR